MNIWSLHPQGRFNLKLEQRNEEWKLGTATSSLHDYLVKFGRREKERIFWFLPSWLCIHHPVLTSYKTNINQIHVYFKTISQYSIDQINASGCTNHDIKDSNSIKKMLDRASCHVVFILFNQNNNYRSETNFKQWS